MMVPWQHFRTVHNPFILKELLTFFQNKMISPFSWALNPLFSPVEFASACLLGGTQPYSYTASASQQAGWREIGWPARAKNGEIFLQWSLRSHCSFKLLFYFAQPCCRSIFKFLINVFCEKCELSPLLCSSAIGEKFPVFPEIVKLLHLFFHITGT